MNKKEINLAVTEPFGTMEVIGMKMCRGCNEADLRIETEKLYEGQKCIMQANKIVCANEKICRNLWDSRIKKV